ncbi:endonuclease/exonuclease/phosphatase family protein [Flagellimonas meridianipacifica]|uniref:Endonuclease/exonuclease/phosphatase family metal-dependent hydrolase n=1 Tax=Flagellimonas meridianipacifica TaxID=1080225 RepID=A0A2T0M9M1_9FLAO|nr:endonuclease/exonuclease/phosphatase family protein [Allomuricauda pacifica]PRX54211.1 endonuclease/exonuclease/phosphatase family metal-dependent hydrolase [Allomuricauda pacifica]
MTKFLFVVNILFSGLLLILSLSYYFNLESFSLFSVFSLFVPILFLINLLFLVFWMFRKSRKLILPLGTLFVGYLFFGSFYAMFNEKGEVSPDDLNIMTFNAWRFNKNGWIKDSNIGDKIIDFIKEEDPDIICIQEHSRMRYKQLRQFNYRSETPPYHVPRTTQAIFSKYPIVSEGSLDLPRSKNNIIYADILIEEDTIRIYNIHLESFKIVPSRESFSEEESEKNYKRLVKTFDKQMEQAKIFDVHRESCPYSYVVCGDMNNTQFSNVYKQLRGDLQDTFFEQGSGFGKTYSLFGLPLRIDYIFPDSSFEVIEHKNYKNRLSDHFPVKATLRRKPNP